MLKTLERDAFVAQYRTEIPKKPGDFVSNLFQALATLAAPVGAHRAASSRSIEAQV